MSQFVVQIKGSSALGYTDLNRVSETILIPIFSEVFDCKNLKNLNFVEKSNYPAIDLGDDISRIAFQVTATPDGEKVKQTLRKFIENKMFEKYDRLIIYILTEKQKNYSTNSFKDIGTGPFNFDPVNDIWDYQNLIEVAGSFQLNRANILLSILEANFAKGGVGVFGSRETSEPESVYMNLLELFFPDTMYVADLKGAKPTAKGGKAKKSKSSSFSSERGIVQKALMNQGLRFGVDWECHERKLVTFHDLTDPDLPLAKIVDQGTVTELEPQEYYEIDENHEKVFKSLLRRCFQQKLFRQHIAWQNEEHLFIFSEVDGMAKRTEKWQGKVATERVVFERTMKNNKPHEILNCKHLAFEIEFKSFAKKWFVAITPDWFFSYDGYKRSPFAEENISWLKRKENNSAVFNQVRFIAYFLKHEKPPDLFTRRDIYPFLSFGDLVMFDTAPKLLDEDWNPPKEDESGEDSSDEWQAELGI